MHEHMKSLLALCVSLCPIAIDDRVSALISVSGKKLARIQKGDLQVQEELFAAAFVSAKAAKTICSCYAAPKGVPALSVSMRGRFYTLPA